MTTKHANILTVRPWTTVLSDGGAFGHFDALVMRTRPGEPADSYGNHEVVCWNDDQRRLFRLDNFRFRCQVDGRRDEAYGWEWGYQPAGHGAFTRRDLEQYGPSIAAISRSLERMEQTDGCPETVGRLVVRLARVLKLDGIAILETSPNSGFRNELTIRHSLPPTRFGAAIGFIDHLVTELHQACARRGRPAAA